MGANDVRDSGQALAYITDCTLATVTDLAGRSRPPKLELQRQIGIAQNAIEWMDRFGVDYSKTRAQDVKDLGGKVEDWAAQFKYKGLDTSPRCKLASKARANIVFEDAS